VKLSTRLLPLERPHHCTVIVAVRLSPVTRPPLEAGETPQPPGYCIVEASLGLRLPCFLFRLSAVMTWRSCSGERCFEAWLRSWFHAWDMEAILPISVSNSVRTCRTALALHSWHERVQSGNQIEGPGYGFGASPRFGDRRDRLRKDVDAGQVSTISILVYS
jgi:hypothetical protein